MKFKDESVLAHEGSNYINMNLIQYKHIESQKKMLLYRYCNNNYLN